MARKRKKKFSRTKSTRAFLRSLSSSMNLSPREARIKRRKMSKYRRSTNYWKMHGDLLFSKIEMRDAEHFWLRVHYPDVTPVLIKVPDAEQYPRYRAGLWDGQAWHVEFKNKRDAAAFKNFMWKLRV